MAWAERGRRLRRIGALRNLPGSIKNRTATAMLTRIHIGNFKRFEEVEFELGQNVVFIGPNNSGKTSALQALALWQAGMRSLPRPKMFDPGDESVIGVLNVKDMTFAPALDPRSL